MNDFLKSFFNLKKYFFYIYNNILISVYLYFYNRKVK